MSVKINCKKNTLYYCLYINESRINWFNFQDFSLSTSFTFKKFKTITNIGQIVKPVESSDESWKQLLIKPRFLFQQVFQLLSTFITRLKTTLQFYNYMMSQCRPSQHWHTDWRMFNEQCEEPFQCCYVKFRHKPGICIIFSYTVSVNLSLSVV